MEPLAIIGLVGNIVQFVDFSSKLISKSIELYRSADGTLIENTAVEAATAHLLILNDKLHNAAKKAGNGELKSLCEKCKLVGDELLATLKKVTADKNRGQVWTSIRKAIRSIWSREKIEDLERQLAAIRQELGLYAITDLRCVSCSSSNEAHAEPVNVVETSLLDLSENTRTASPALILRQEQSWTP